MTALTVQWVSTGMFVFPFKQGHKESSCQATGASISYSGKSVFDSRPTYSLYLLAFRRFSQFLQAKCGVVI
jgi:hypothetical protein